MSESPNIARIAALIGDPARALMLQALMSGKALTGAELALVAGVGKATASAHLARLTQGGLIRAVAQGRHKYHGLASPDVAAVLEGLMALAATPAPPLSAPPVPKSRPPRTAPQTGPRDPALRAARLCYNHLAGARGVQMHDSLAARGGLTHGPEGPRLTAEGVALLSTLGLDAQALSPHPAPHCRACLDWSERRHHLGGRLGRALLARILALGWARRQPGSRVLHFTPQGSAAFDRIFPPQGRGESLDAPADCP